MNIIDYIDHDLTLWCDPYMHPRAVQQRLVARGWPIAVDGVIGPNTRAALDEALDCHAGMLTAHPRLPLYWSTAPSRKPRVIVIHWTGGTRDACGFGDYLATKQDQPHLRVSTHYGTDEARTVRYLDPQHARAWHCGTDNGTTIGVDICQPPLASQIARAQARNLRVSRGGAYLTIDPRIAERTRALVGVLCRKHGIPAVPAPQDGTTYETRTAKGWASLGVGVVGHHHLTRRKIDVVPWWGALWA
jgi:hypothetical protein